MIELMNKMFIAIIEILVLCAMFLVGAAVFLGIFYEKPVLSYLPIVCLILAIIALFLWYQNKKLKSDIEDKRYQEWVDSKTASDI